MFISFSLVQWVRCTSLDGWWINESNFIDNDFFLVWCLIFRLIKKAFLSIKIKYWNRILIRIVDFSCNILLLDDLKIFLFEEEEQWNRILVRIVHLWCEILLSDLLKILLSVKTTLVEQFFYENHSSSMRSSIPLT